MKKIIELKDFKRRESVEFFSTFKVAIFSITSEVECTGARSRAKEQGITFSLLYTHAILQAVNEIDEFHYYIDANGDIVWYDTINGIIVASKNKETYIHVLLDYKSDLHSFCKEATQKINGANHESILFNVAGKLNYHLVSANPFLNFTSCNPPIRTTWEEFMPLSIVGKLITREGKEYLPITISANHAFVDGIHVGKFYTRVQELL